MSAEGMWKGMGARLVVTVPVGGSRRCGTGIWSGFRITVQNREFPSTAAVVVLLRKGAN